MALLLGTASASVTLDVGQLLGAAKQAEGALNQLGSITGSKAKGSFFDNMTKGALGLGTALVVPMTMGLNAAIDLEQQMANVDAALGDISDNELSILAEQFNEIAVNSQYSAVQIGAVAEELAKAGIAQEDLEQTTLAVVNLSQATGDNLTTSLEAVTVATAIWSEGMVDAENVLTDFTEVSDILTTVSNNTRASLTDINAGMRALAPAAARAGLSYNEATAAIGFFVDMGLTGADAGVSLARSLTELADPTSEASAAMAAYGIVAYDAQGAFIGFPALFNQLQTAMVGLTQQEQELILSTIFGAEAIDVMGIAALTGGEDLQTLTDATNESGTAAEQSAIRMDTLGAQLGTLKEGINTFLGSLVSGLIPGMRIFVNAGNRVIDMLMKIPGPIKTVIGAVAGLLAGIASIKIAIASFSALSGFLGLAGLGASIASIALPILAVAAAVGLLYAAWQTNFLGIRDITADVFDGIMGYLEPVTDFVDRFKTAWDDLGTSMSTWSLMGQTFTTEMATDLGFVERAVLALHEATGGLSTLYIEVGQDMVNAITPAIAMLGELSRFVGTEFFVPLLDWSVFIAPIAWDGFVTALDWAIFAAPIVWDSFLVALDWALFVTPIVWDTFVTVFDWATFITPIAWDSFVVALGWATFVTPIAWDTFVTVIDWALFVTPIVWDTFVTALDWTIFAAPIAWDTFVDVLSWATFIDGITWGDFVDALHWSLWLDEITWGDYISDLSWSTFVTAIDWGAYIFALGWDVFLDVLDWSLWIDDIAWGDYIPNLSWPSKGEILNAITLGMVGESGGGSGFAGSGFGGLMSGIASLAALMMADLARAKIANTPDYSPDGPIPTEVMPLRLDTGYARVSLEQFRDDAIGVANDLKAAFSGSIDTSGLTAGLQSAKAEMAGMGESARVVADGMKAAFSGSIDVSGLTSGLAAAKAEMAGMGEAARGVAEGMKSAFASLDTGSLMSGLADAKARLAETITVRVDNSAALTAVSAVSEAIANLSGGGLKGGGASVSITADTTAAVLALSVVRGLMTGLNGLSSTVILLGNSTAAVTAITTVRGLMSAINGMTSTIIIRGDNSQALAAIRAVQAYAGRSLGTATFTVRTVTTNSPQAVGASMGAGMLRGWDASTGTRSPSTEMIKRGQYLFQGLDIGWTGSASNLPVGFNVAKMPSAPYVPNVPNRSGGGAYGIGGSTTNHGNSYTFNIAAGDHREEMRTFVAEEFLPAIEQRVTQRNIALGLT